MISMDSMEKYLEKPHRW